MSDVLKTNDRMIHEMERLRKEKVVAYFNSLSNIIKEALTKNNAQHSQDNWCQARDLKLGLPEYEAGMLATRPQRSTIHVLRI
jgi:hypothetical protein